MLTVKPREIGRDRLQEQEVTEKPGHSYHFVSFLGIPRNFEIEAPIILFGKERVTQEERGHLQVTYLRTINRQYKNNIISKMSFTMISLSNSDNCCCVMESAG